MDNDVMFGKPISRFDSLAAGKEAYEARKVTPDLYALQNDVTAKDNRLTLQIKEIEPELSAYDHVALHRIPVASDERLVVRSDFSAPLVFKQHALEEDARSVGLTIRNNCNTDVTQQLRHRYLRTETENAGEVDMVSGSYLEIALTNASANEGGFLFLESWYRDWTLGDVYEREGIAAFQRIKSPFSSKNVRRGVMTGVLGSILGLFGANASTTDNDSNTLANAFFTPTVHADDSSCTSSSGSCTSCRSLVVTYLHRTTGRWIHIDTIEPRYAQPSTVAIALPAGAFDADGNAKVRISATKRHRVSGIAFAHTASAQKREMETLELQSARLERTNTDYANILSTPFDKRYVESGPGDVLTLEFGEGDCVGNVEASALLLSFGGVYTYASYAEQQRFGKWTESLDDQALAMLSDVYHYSRA